MTRNILRLFGEAKIRDAKFVCHLRASFCHFSPALLGSPCLEMEEAVVELISVGKVAEQVQWKDKGHRMLNSQAWE